MPYSKNSKPSSANIGVVGFNPTYELTYEVPVLRPTVVTANRFTKTFAGKATTVARVLTILKDLPILITPLPADDTPHSISGVDIVGLPIPTRPRYSVVVGEASGPKRLIVRYDGDELDGKYAETLARQLIQAVAGLISGISVLVIAGSLLRGLNCGIVRELLDLAAKNNVLSVVDVAGESLVCSSGCQCTIIKVNRREFQDAFRVRTQRDIERTARQLTAQLGAWIVITDGHRPVSVYEPDSVPARITLRRQHTAICCAGAGDAMAAGLASGLSRGRHMRDVILSATRFAVLAAGGFGSADCPPPDEDLSRLAAYV